MEHEPVVNNWVTQELRRFISDEMNGLHTNLVIQKNLNRSDLEVNQNRLNMPIHYLETQDFVTVEEIRDVEMGKGIEVQAVGPRLQMYEKPMVLKTWHMTSTKNYVLKTNWNDFVKDNKDDLKKNSKIQLWSFRKDQQLCFALVVVERADAGNGV